MAIVLPIICNAQCNENTKKCVDSLKTSIKYPLFNIGDTLYIAFIKDPNIGTNYVTERDIDAMKVKIVNMRLYNDIAGANSTHIFSLDGVLPVEWEYQFIDMSIKNPKYKDFSYFYPEVLFSTTIKGAKKALMKNVKH